MRRMFLPVIRVGGSNWSNVRVGWNDKTLVVGQRRGYDFLVKRGETNSKRSCLSLWMELDKKSLPLKGLIRYPYDPTSPPISRDPLILLQDEFCLFHPSGRVTPEELDEYFTESVLGPPYTVSRILWCTSQSSGPDVSHGSRQSE